MGRIVLGVIAGFLAWVIVWVGSEMIFSAMSPDWYGAHQRAFTAAIKGGSPFSADSTILAIHIVCASIIAVLSGFLAALVGRDNRRAPLVLGIVLIALGILKAVMSWPLVPIWYHVLFTVMPVPMAILGGKLKAATAK